ncbi:uncharacterized protein LOC126833853 [Adelges cooleyi]|uniref:uncharacterized protein LOC126833853 n=1 Tax=Adelges cooleyi TaxID=133065 RepID=UPI00217F7687|nr:uncharacterized protein LOC126833853 [Adelges cooleyi]
MCDDLENTFLYGLRLQFVLANEYDGFIRTVTQLFLHRHIRTVTAATCWSSVINSNLLVRLSDVDVSVTFHPSTIPSHNPWYRYGILIDLSCTNFSSPLFKQAFQDRLFNMQNDWILFGGQTFSNDTNSSTNVLKIFETYLRDAYVLPDSRVYLFSQTDQDAWEIWEGYRISYREKIRVFQSGMATTNNLCLNDSNAERMNFRGNVLKATTVIVEPDKFTGFHPFAYTNLDVFAHMHNDLNAVLQDQLNFKMELTITNDYGWDLGNGSFSGMTGNLQREECDFGGIGSFIRSDRMTVVDYTVGTFYRQPAALYKQPSLSSVYNICVLPFNFEVWLVTFFTFLGFTIVILCLNRTSKIVRHDEIESITILDSVTLVHGAICQQGYSVNLTTASSRIAVFVLFTTAVFLYTSYSASIVALLQTPSNSIKTVEDIIQSPMTFSAQISPYSEVYFVNTDDPLLLKLYDKKMKPSGDKKFTNALEGLKRIQTEFHGFVVELITAYKIISDTWREEEKCGLSEVQLFKLPILALAVVKKSGYKDVFKQKLIQQQEVGIKNRIIRRWIPMKPMCDSSNRANEFVSVSFNEVYPMFQVYGFGVVLSVLVLIVEKIHQLYYLPNFVLDGHYYYNNKPIFIINLMPVIGDKYNNLINGLTNMLKYRNINTVWVATCWGSDVNNELLTMLSAVDISVAFDPEETIHKTQYETWYRSGLLVDLSCSQAPSILQQASDDRRFTIQNDWILFDQRGNANKFDALDLAVQTFDTFMDKARLLPDSRVYLLVEIKDNVWEIWDGFRSKNNEKIRVTKVGILTPHRAQMNYSNSERTNLRGSVIKSAAAILEPKLFRGWGKSFEFSLDVFAHMHHNLVILLADQLNFTLDLIIEKDYGWNLGNGTFGGLMGMLQKEEIEFACSGALMRTDRMDVADVTVPTFPARTTTIFKQPPLSAVYNVFILPFDIYIWMVILILLLLFTIAIVFLVRSAAMMENLNLPLQSILFTASDTVMLVIGAICQQGTPTIINTTSSRLAVFVLFVTALFVFTSYAASIVVLLQTPSQAIKSIKDLAETSISFSALDTTHNYIYFNETDNQYVKKIYRNKMLPEGQKKAFTKPDVGMARVRNEFHAYLVEATFAYDIVAKTWQEQEKCSLSELELFKLPMLTLFIVKKSGYRDIMKEKLIRQNEVGLRNRIFKKMMPQKQMCDSLNRAIEFDSVSAREIFPALILLGYGMCVSLLVFVLELTYNARETWRKNQHYF